MAGETYLLKLYGAKQSECLNTYRFLMYNRKIKITSISSEFKQESLSPTKAAAKYHSYRVYLTVQQWLQNELSPFEWGWVYNGNILVPIKTDRPVVPDSALNLIACGCKTGCLKSCGCRKVRVYCSPMCSHCNGQTCWNIHPIVTDGDEEN